MDLGKALYELGLATGVLPKPLTAQEAEGGGYEKFTTWEDFKASGPSIQATDTVEPFPFMDKLLERFARGVYVRKHLDETPGWREELRNSVPMMTATAKKTGDMKLDDTSAWDAIRKALEDLEAQQGSHGGGPIAEFRALMEENRAAREKDLDFIKDQVRIFRPEDISDANIQELTGFADDMVKNKKGALAYAMLNSVASGGTPIDPNLLSGISSAQTIRDKIIHSANVLRTGTTEERRASAQFIGDMLNGQAYPAIQQTSIGAFAGSVGNNSLANTYSENALLNYFGNAVRQQNYTPANQGLTITDLGNLVRIQNALPAESDEAKRAGEIIKAQFEQLNGSGGSNDNLDTFNKSVTYGVK